MSAGIMHVHIYCSPLLVHADKDYLLMSQPSLKLLVDIAADS